MGGTVRYNRREVDNDLEERLATGEVPSGAAGMMIADGVGLEMGTVMSIDDIKKRFVNEIKLRAYDDKYIDKIEEREILQIAIQLGVSIDSARPALFQVCNENDFVVESVIVKLIKDHFESASGGDGKIDRKEFDAVFEMVKKAVGGKKNDREIKKLIVNVMENTGNNRVKTGWFTNWYTRLKKDLGV
jgi:hypothetical protein